MVFVYIPYIIIYYIRNYQFLQLKQVWYSGYNKYISLSTERTFTPGPDFRLPEQPTASNGTVTKMYG